MKLISKRKSILSYLLLSAVFIIGCRSDKNSEPEQASPAQDTNSVNAEKSADTDTDALIKQILSTYPEDANTAEAAKTPTPEPNTITTDTNLPEQTQTTIEDEPNITAEQLKEKAKQRTIGSGTQWTPEQVEQLRKDLRNMTSQQRREYIKNFMKQDNQENTN